MQRICAPQTAQKPLNTSKLNREKAGKRRCRTPNAQYANISRNPPATAGFLLCEPNYPPETKGFFLSQSYWKIFKNFKTKPACKICASAAQSIPHSSRKFPASLCPAHFHRFLLAAHSIKPKAPIPVRPSKKPFPAYPRASGIFRTKNTLFFSEKNIAK